MSEAKRFIERSHGKGVANEILRQRIRTVVDTKTGETLALFDDGSWFTLKLKDAVRLDELRQEVTQDYNAPGEGSS